MTTQTIPNDPLFPQQWYLHNTGQTGGTFGIDLNVMPAWVDYIGRGVRVGVIDDGIDASHPDLVNPYNAATSLDTAQLFNDGSPVRQEDNHGTAVAGLIAATANNGEGGVGVAYGATISSIRVDFVEASAEGIGLALRQMENFDVVNNSWGFVAPFSDNRLEADIVPLLEAVRAAATHGRKGLGTVVVFSGGNNRMGGDQANYHNLQNSPYVIAVAALNHYGQHTSYSSPGANLLVSALGGDAIADSITTTDRLGNPGYSTSNYTSSFGGTSAAAPMVSGVVALMLEANPNLGYRDVQEILAYSARQTDTQNPSWQVNRANNWNGGGLPTSLDYGFGLVDAHAAVRLAETWTTQHSTVNQLAVEATAAPNLAIRDNTEATSQLTLTQQVTLDRVELSVDIAHTWIGDLTLELISPNGTESTLLLRPGLGSYAYGLSQDDLRFTFSSTQFWGEDAAGTWTLRVGDRAPNDQGILKSWTLHALGDSPSSNNTYIYTNAFAQVGYQSNRTILQDEVGYDTLNAATVTQNLTLDLRSGQTSRVAGRNLAIAPTTVIESAFGGDGDDIIGGNGAANALHGGRGQDVLVGRGNRDRLWGRSGHDVLVGGQGNDTLIGGGGRDRFHFAGANLGVDTLTDFQTGRDKISLSKTTFSTLTSNPGKGFRVAQEFAVVTTNRAAARSVAQIVYNQTTGRLFYNANGPEGGLGQGGLFAVLRNTPSLSVRDFIVVA